MQFRMEKHCVCSVRQAMKELKRTEYNHIKATVIGSREQLCIQPLLKPMSNAEKITACKTLRKKNACRFHERNMMYEMSKNFDVKFQENVMDIEDLRKAGREHGRCPYYAAKVIAEKAQVIFMAYNVSDTSLVNYFFTTISLN